MNRLRVARRDPVVQRLVVSALVAAACVLWGSATVSAAPAQGPAPSATECVDGLVLTGVQTCAVTGEVASVTMQIATTVSNPANRLAYVGHPTLTPSELCSVVTRSGGPLRNCGSETASTIAVWPGVSPSSTGAHTVTFGSLPAGSWVAWSQSTGSSHVEFVHVASDPQPTTTTTSTTSTTTTTVVAPTTTVPPVDPGPVEPPDPAEHVIGSREAAQWLACCVAFAAGHLVGR